MNSIHYQDDSITLYCGDALNVLKSLPNQSVNCCVTSPPYFGLRDYGIEGQYGLEASSTEYVETLRTLFSEVYRVLADDGTLWLNIGDSYSTNLGEGNVGGNLQGGKRNSYRRHCLSVSPLRRRSTGNGLPQKNMFGIPWRVAFALQDDGWILRNDIIWYKGNGMPSSVTDRLSNKHEHVFLFAKSKRYYFDLDSIREPLVKPDENYPEGKNPGDVWKINTQPFSGAHFAVMPLKLAELCITAGSRRGDVILDPFSGSATVGKVSLDHGRRYVGIDLSAEYLDMSLRTRLNRKPIDELDRILAELIA